MWKSFLRNYLAGYFKISKLIHLSGVDCCWENVAGQNSGSKFRQYREQHKKTRLLENKDTYNCSKYLTRSESSVKTLAIIRQQENCRPRDLKSNLMTCFVIVK